MLDEWKAAFLRHTPPTDLMLDAGRKALGPAAGTAVVLFGLVLLLLGKRSALFAGSLAMLAAFGVANYYREVFYWWPIDRPDLMSDTPSLLSPPSWHWISLLFLATQFFGLLARVPSVPLWGGWGLRFGIGFLAALVLVPPGFHTQLPEYYASWPFPLQAKVWPILIFGLAIALGWAGTEQVAKNNPGPMVAFGLAASLFGASLVIAHSHTGKYADAVSIPAAALVGIGLVSIFCRVDTGGALPAVSLILPSMLFIAYQYMSEQTTVPWQAFVYASLSPLAVSLMALPPFSRLTGFAKWAVFLVLCLSPTVAGVTYAVKAETLVDTQTVEDEWK